MSTAAAKQVRVIRDLLELPLTAEAFARYEVALGETRIDITPEGRAALRDEQGQA